MHLPSPSARCRANTTSTQRRLRTDTEAIRRRGIVLKPPNPHVDESGMYRRMSEDPAGVVPLAAALPLAAFGTQALAAPVGPEVEAKPPRVRG